MKRIIFTLFLTAMAMNTFAQSPQTETQPANTANVFCPNIADIQKNPTKGNWTAETKTGSWKTYHLSFASNIVQFVGAQWVGEDVGQITCVYSSEQRFMLAGVEKIEQTPPILLVFHTLTFQPTIGKWTHSSAGVYNCNATAQNDCPFKMNARAPEGSIIQQAEALKSDKSETLEVPTN